MSVCRAQSNIIVTCKQFQYWKNLKINIMESKTYVFGGESQGGGNGMMAMLAPLLQQKGIDPNLLLTMNRNGGFGGEGGWFIWVIFLFFLMGWGRNGWGGFGGGNGGFGTDAAATTYPLASLINNDNGRELLMSAIQGNGNAINSLASTLNCSVGQVQQAINGLMGQVQSVSNQVGTSSMQIINAIQAGNCNIASQLASCCCDIRTAIERQGYDNRIATADQSALLGGKIDAQSTMISDKFCQLEMREMQNKIDALREEKSALQGQLSQEHQTAQLMASQQATVAPINAALNDLSKRLADIECKQPSTTTIPYSPVVGVPTCVAAQYGLGVNPYTPPTFWT